MATTPKLLAKGTLADNNLDTLYTVPGATTAIVNYFVFTNTAASGALIDIKAGDAGTERFWRDDLPIPAHESVEFNGSLVLETADVLKAIGTGVASGSVNFFVCGLEVT